MSISTPFIFRPIATLLLTIGMALVGGVAYFQLPVAPLPQVDYPTISVTASLPGAAPGSIRCWRCARTEPRAARMTRGTGARYDRRARLALRRPIPIRETP